MHRKVLTGENLEKRDMQGPSKSTLCLLLEHFNSINLHTSQPNILDFWEAKWMEGFPIKTFSPLHAHSRSAWKLQHSINDFSQWLRAQDHFTLCFDGASKGNPKVAGMGGVLYDPGGNIENTYSWNLGVATNN
jgi:hypothetical protein